MQPTIFSFGVTQMLLLSRCSKAGLSGFGDAHIYILIPSDLDIELCVGLFSSQINIHVLVCSSSQRLLWQLCE